MDGDIRIFVVDTVASRRASALPKQLLQRWLSQLGQNLRIFPFALICVHLAWSECLHWQWRKHRVGRHRTRPAFDEHDCPDRHPGSHRAEHHPTDNRNRLYDGVAPEKPAGLSGGVGGR